MLVLTKKRHGFSYRAARDCTNLSRANKLFLICCIACLCLPLVEAFSGYRYPSTLTEGSLPPCLRQNLLLLRNYATATADLELLDCSWQTRIYRTRNFHSKRSLTKQILSRVHVGMLGNLAVLVCYGAGLVYSSIVLLFISGRMSISSTSFDPLCNQSLANTVLQLKADMITVFVSILLVLQYSLFSIVTIKQCVLLTSRELKQIKERINAFIYNPLSTCLNRFHSSRRVISMLLLLCGDVEKNPGPTPPHHQRCHSFPSFFQEPNTDIENLKFEAKYNQLLVDQLKASLRICQDYILKLKTDEEEVTTESNSSVNRLNDELDNCHSNIKELEASVAQSLSDISNLEAEWEKCQKQTAQLKADEARTDSDMAKKLSKAREGCKNKQKEVKELKSRVAQLERELHTLKSTSREQAESPPTLQFNNCDDRVQTMYLELNHLIQTCIDPRTCLPSESQKSVYVDQLSSLLIEYNEWLCTRESHQRGCTLFYVLVNQLYLSESENVFVCPFCCYKKEKRRLRNPNDPNDPRSHIWPLNLFLSFRRIHQCRDSLYDVFSYVNLSGLAPSPISPDKISIRMLCQVCEHLGEEEKLLNHYCFFNAYPFSTLTFKNADSWFHHTLAVIMTRGILRNCNLLKELKNKGSDVLPALFELLEFCVNPKNTPSHQLSVFLPPNYCYPHKELHGRFERQLRNPEFTSVFDLHSEGKDGRFFYMQFDCLHVIYPLCEESADYFQSYSREDYPCALSKDVIFPSSDVRYELFPRVLLTINLSRGRNRIPCWDTSEHCRHSLAVVKYNEDITIGPAIPPYSSPKTPTPTGSMLQYDQEVERNLQISGVCPSEKYSSYRKFCEDHAREHSLILQSIRSNTGSVSEVHHIRNISELLLQEVFNQVSIAKKLDVPEDYKRSILSMLAPIQQIAERIPICLQTEDIHSVPIQEEDVNSSFAQVITQESPDINQPEMDTIESIELDLDSPQAASQLHANGDMAVVTGQTPGQQEHPVQGEMVVGL